MEESKKQYQELKKLLEEMRVEILKDINERRLREHTSHDEVGDDYDKASQEREREMDIIITAQEKNRLQSIDDALRRIEEGSYGICEECGEKIPKQRLKALPFATLCVSCKSAKESEEGVFTPFEEIEEEPFEEITEEITSEEEEE